MKTILITSAFALLALSATAQELHFPSGKEKHDSKPARFQSLQQNRSYNSDAASLHGMMGFTVNQKISVSIGNGYSFKGTVIEKKQERADLLTVVARSSEDPQLLLSISRVMIGGQPTFRGIILSKSGSDLIMLEPDELGNYAWNVKKVSQLLAD